MDANNYYGNGYVNNAWGYPQQPIMGPGYPVMYNQIPQPQNRNASTDEEINIMKNARPGNDKLDLSIDNIDVLRSMCTHKDNGHDVVNQVNDGTGDVWCPICQEKWNAEAMSYEEVVELVDKLISAMQNAKWLGDLPIEVVREFFTIIPLLKKFPKLYQYAMNNFNKFYNANQMYGAQDTSIYNQFNSLFNPGYGYNGGYNGYGYNYQMQQQMQQPIGQYQYANPNVNPMQAPTQGYAPQNRPMTYQPQMMAQPQQPQAPQYYQQQPAYQPQMMQQPQQAPVYSAAPVQQPAAPQTQQPAQPAEKSDKVTAKL